MGGNYSGNGKAIAIKFVEKVLNAQPATELKMITPLVDKVESLRPQMQALSDEERARRHRNTRIVMQTENRSMIFFRRHLRRFGKQQSVY